MSAQQRTTPTELKQGCSVTFADGRCDTCKGFGRNAARPYGVCLTCGGDGQARASGIVNGEPWAYFDGETHVRIPVFVDDGRTLDVAGANLRSVTP